jgi:hypothetical protein
MTEAYPLRWPEGWPRQNGRKGTGPFRTSADTAIRSLYENMRSLKATGLVVSSNCKIRQDGTPYREDMVARLKDSGVAVYFTYAGKPMVMAQDAYQLPMANIRSLALAIEAMRAIERHGGGYMMQRSFDGFAALPPPGGEAGYVKPPWRKVLKMDAYGEIAPEDAILLAEAKYKQLARQAHPDAEGGDAQRMAELNVAIEDARAELGA